MTQFFVHRIADVDAAVGHNPVGHGRGGDAFVPPFRRYLIPNAVQGEKKIALLLETDDFAAVSGLVGTVQRQPERPLGRGNTDEDGVALPVIGKTEFRFGCVDDDFFLLDIGIDRIRLPLCEYGGNRQQAAQYP